MNYELPADNKETDPPIKVKVELGKLPEINSKKRKSTI